MKLLNVLAIFLQGMRRIESVVGMMARTDRMIRGENRLGWMMVVKDPLRGQEGMDPDLRVHIAGQEGKDPDRKDHMTGQEEKVPDLRGHMKGQEKCQDGIDHRKGQEKDQDLNDPVLRIQESATVDTTIVTDETGKDL